MAADRAPHPPTPPRPNGGSSTRARSQPINEIVIDELRPTPSTGQFEFRMSLTRQRARQGRHRTVRPRRPVGPNLPRRRGAGFGMHDEYKSYAHNLMEVDVRGRSPA